VRVPLAEVVQFNPKPSKGALADSSEVSFVPMAAVEAGSGRMDASTVKPFAEVKKGFTYFADGDVLFAKITPCMENGKSAVAKGLRNGVGFGSTEFHVLRPSERIDARFLYQFVAGASFRREAAHHMTGAVGQKRVPVEFLRQAQIPLPSLQEQHATVDEIEKQFSRLDQALSGLLRITRRLSEFSRAYLHTVFQSKDAGQKRRLEQVCEVTSGYAFKSGDFVGEGVPAIKIANVGFGKYLTKDQDYLPSAFEGMYAGFSVKPHDLLLALTRPITANTLKVCAYPEGSRPALLNQRVAILRPSSQQDADFLLAYMHSPQFKRCVQDSMSQTLQPNLSPVDLRRFAVPWPESSERERIVAEVDRRLSIARGVEAQVEANLKRAQSLRQAILAKAFTF
jgi:type I restriction enzyme S subunit